MLSVEAVQLAVQQLAEQAAPEARVQRRIIMAALAAAAPMQATKDRVVAGLVARLALGPQAAQRRPMQIVVVKAAAVRMVDRLLLIRQAPPGLQEG